MNSAKGDHDFVQSCVLDELWSFFLATRAELALFFAAVVAYLLLFGNAAPKGERQRRGAKARQLKVVADDADNDDDSDLWTAETSEGALSAAERKRLEQSFDAAFAAGDHRQALRCWAGLRRSDVPPAISVAKAVKSMLRMKKDGNIVVRELKGHFQRHPSACRAPGALAEAVEPLARRPDPELATAVIEAAEAAAGARPDEQCFEVLLSMHFSAKNLAQVQALLDETAARGVALTTKARLVAVKAALKGGNFAEACRHFAELKTLFVSSDPTPSVAPQQIVSQLVDLACGERRLGDLLALFEEAACGDNGRVPIGEEVAKAMLVECLRRKDWALSQRTERLIRAGTSPSDATFALLARCAGLADGATAAAQLEALVDEVTKRGTPLSPDFTLAALAPCAQHSGCLSLADWLAECSNLQQQSVASALVRFYAEAEEFDKACDLYERCVAAAAPVGGRSGDTAPRQPAVSLDARAVSCLMNAALRSGRHNLAKHVLDACPADVAKHIAMVRGCAAKGDLAGAHEVFNGLLKTGIEVNSVVYNTVLDACVECRDLKAAEAWMETTKKAGRADVVSYNTLIKAHLQSGNVGKARDLVAQMRAEGLQPNRITFNELANGIVSGAGGGDAAARRRELWGVVKEMQAAGVKPNQVTCSILLKGLNARSRQAEINETMDLITNMDEPMDEVLLSSVVEACVRIGQPALLAAKLKQLQGAQGAAVNGSHTFGSLIKAYGHAKDMAGVWRCWREMRSRRIRPTGITTGCMVEAVVSNGDTEGAYELIQEIRQDESCRDVLNAVIYCSVLKGFTREKRIDRVWAVYEEMLSMKVELSPVTYNTLLDACARSSQMDRAPGIMQDMKAKGIQPNLITYSTLVKGHCQAGDLDRGFATLEEMCRETDFKPDEIMYNSLLDGCAQGGMVGRGLSVLERMQREGVPPSNYSLSLLVKLMSRARRLDGAFELVDKISAKYGFRPNVHVFTNLIQACIANRQLQRGMATFERMLKERVRPESRTIAILARASLAQGAAEQAAGLLRAALGLPTVGMSPVAEDLLPHAVATSLDPAVVSEALQGLADRGRVHDLAVPL
eukprot:CAMPEP_0170208154 /NCGR_PEP_ID=MMETSP0116_2-20130129/3659_1 /TAXON_ID=400756 /ORGANISM="Durinskia baltica, Strain CSIRO CS-38" /LENGTH=1079 /DNA_ID=CAMNT_0010458621 /DNA_START=88 /DNA_END=3324 /DNA_ORIENTATION=+